MLDVIIIGGGVSGLSAAHELMRAGRDVAVLERQVVAGGNAISERFGGFLMEHGPTTFNASIPEAVSQIDALGLLGNAADLGPGVKKRYLCDGGRLSGIPVSPSGFFRSSYLSLPARARMLAEMAIPRGKGGEESIYAFTRRRFGREFAEKVMDPMAAGMFMGEAKALSVNGVFPKLVELEQRFGSISRGVLAARKGHEPGRHLYSWHNGIATLPQALAARLGGRLHLGETVRGISSAAHGFEVKTANGTRRARKVVLAVQPHVAAALLAPLDAPATTALQAITAPPVNVLFFGYERGQIQHPLDGLGFLTTTKSEKLISGAQFASTMYESRAPKGMVAISAYIGGARHADISAMPEAERMAIVQQELADLLGIKGPPKITRLRHWALGLPQYTLGHQSRMAILAGLPDRTNGVYLTGNYLHGVSLANCMATAKTTARALHESLSSVASTPVAKQAG